MKEFDYKGEKLEKWSTSIYGNIIEVYDWEGIKKVIIKLDHYGQRIMMSDDKTKLYLLSDGFWDRDKPKFEMWTYELGGIISNK